jgi:fimbrial chaperone protein
MMAQRMNRRFRNGKVGGRLWCWLALLIGLLPFSAMAQLQVQPLVVEFSPGASATFITISNKGDMPATLQVRSFAWTQTTAADALSPDATLAFSPPFATIPAESSQIIRLALQQPRAAGEAAYQLVLDDIPPAVTEPGVHLQFRIKIPVFTETDRFAAAQIAWRLELDDQGQATLTATNEGSKHLRIGMITLSLAGGQNLHLQSNGSFYVLPGVERHWPISVAAAAALHAGTKILLTATGEHGALHATLIAGTP